MIPWSWRDIPSKPMRIKTKHKDRNKSTLFLKGKVPFCSPEEHCGQGEGLSLNPEMEQSKAGLWPYLMEKQTDV